MYYPKLLSRFFSVEALLRALPWLLSLVGMLSIIIGFVFYDKDSVIHGIMTSVGQAILIGGVFSALLKTFQYIGIFRDTLLEVIYEDRFLNIRSDLVDLWSRISSALYKGKFPDLAGDLHKSVIDQYFPTRKSYYFGTHKRICTISWSNKERGILRLEEETVADMIPAKDDGNVEYTYFYIPMHPSKEENTERVLHTLKVDEIDFKDELEKQEVINPRGAKTIKHVYKIHLHGKPSYKLTRILERTFDVWSDPYTRYYSETFMVNPEIKVNVVADDLRVEFLSLGTLQEFRNAGPTRRHTERVSDIDVAYDGLVFPRQGYMLIFMPRGAAGGGESVV